MEIHYSSEQKTMRARLGQLHDAVYQYAGRRALCLSVLALFSLAITECAAAASDRPNAVSRRAGGPVAAKDDHTPGLNDRCSAVGVNSRGEILINEIPDRLHLVLRAAVVQIAAPRGTFIHGAALNDAGQVVGTVFGPTGKAKAVVWADGKMRYLPLPPRGRAGWARGINDRGDIVGECAISVRGAPNGRAVLWSGSAVSPLVSLYGVNDAATGINDHRQIVGACFDMHFIGRAVLWDHGEVRDLGTLGGAGASASAINDEGKIVGQSKTPSGHTHAFLWESGHMIDLGTLGGQWRESSAHAISPVGTVVGNCWDAKGALRAFIWKAGKMAALPSLANWDAEAAGVNDAGEVVGHLLSDDSDHPASQAVMWVDGKMSRLDLSLPAR